MFRRTGSAECTSCEQRDWERHCSLRHCGWYVCRTCGTRTDSRRGRSFNPGAALEGGEERRSA